MADADEQSRDQREHRPRRPAKGARRGQEQDPRGDRRLAAAGGGAQHVAAVELSDGHQVQRRHEDAEPCRHEGRMLVHVGARVEAAPRQALRQVHDERVFEEPRLRARGSRSGDRPRPADPVEQEGHRHDEPRERSGRADVEKRLLVPDRLLDANQGAEGPDEREEGRRNEIRQRRGKTVALAHRVVPELVRAQDDEQRNRKRETVGEVAAPQRTSSGREGETSGDGRRDESRQQ
ncbi:MAG TPA: hypothetical protein VER78_03795 [Thermoanaerobaculia bacterium]|nr:hypothetical protein [Thermoanaerobaculia bacterium]